MKESAIQTQQRTLPFVLEKRVIQGKGKCHRIVWKRYVACGDRALLERVRMGQERPEGWRVSRLTDADMGAWRKAG